MRWMGRQKVQLFLEQGVFSGTGFAVNIGLVKVLDLSDYGRFASLTILLYLLLSVGQALIVQPMQIHVGRAAGGEYRSVLLLLVAAFLLACAGALGLAYWLAPGILRTYHPVLLPFTGYLLAFLAADFYRKYFLARGEVGVALVAGLAYPVFLAAGFGLLFYRGSADLAPYLGVLGLAYLPGLLFAGIRYARRMALPRAGVLRRYLRVHLVEGQWLLYAAVVQWLSGNLYVMLSGVLIGLEALGVLRFVQTLLGVINVALQTIENYVLPQLSRAYRADPATCYGTFRRELRIYQGGLLAVLATLFVGADVVIVAAGNPEFAPYAHLLRGMVVLYGIIVFAYPIRLLIRVTELNRSYFLAYLVSFLCSLLTYRFLLTEFGVMGAVAGLVLNQLILQATWLGVLNKQQFTVWKLYI